MFNVYNPAIGLVFAVAALAIPYYYYFFRRRKGQNDGTPVVSKLFIYPIKSLKGFEVDRIEVRTTGMKYGPFRDRSFILLSASNEMVTMRTKPKLCFINTSIHGNEIWLDVPGMDTLKVDNDLDVSGNEVFLFKIHQFEGRGHYYSKEAEEWFTKYTGSPVKLIKYSDDLEFRETTSAMDPIINHVIYQDRCPIMLINHASIEDLNTRLPKDEQVDVRNFRPNIYVTGSGPYAEDDWKHIKIGNITFNNIMPGGRCILTTVDQDKGARNTSLNPLPTMRKYRIKEHIKHKFNPNAPLFGINLSPYDDGSISTNQKVQILDYVDY